jgi:hypothetical protein
VHGSRKGLTLDHYMVKQGVFSSSSRTQGVVICKDSPEIISSVDTSVESGVR